MTFKIKTLYKPSGDQPTAIKKILSNFQKQIKEQIILGATGTGKTFTIANVIQKLNQNTLIIVHNKTLAGQLYNELKEIFPENKIEYFISYYDYYQPEAYVVSSDTYIKKTSKINGEIDQLRHRTINSLIYGSKVIVISSVSCIYGIGDINDYKLYVLYLERNKNYSLKDISKQLVEMQYKRNDVEFDRGTFRIKGNNLEIILSSENKKGIRIIFDNEEIEQIQIFNIPKGDIIENLNNITIFPASLYMANKQKIKETIKRIQTELNERIQYFKEKNKLVEMQNLKKRITNDIEMLQQIGYCSSIENYSRHLSLKKQGEAPTTLIDYFNKNFLTIIDESHVTIPQIKGMYAGDRSRKQNLVKYGFCLPSALDNRPLMFSEFEKKLDKVIYLSATPGDYELEKKIPIIEQIIRPTFILDPEIEVRPTKNQIEDLYFEIKKRAKKNERTLVTTITINMSEELTNYLKKIGIKVTYLHSKIKSLERMIILKQLRSGIYDCLIGVNLLREGLDLPEVSLVAILDADKTGFLRSEKSLIQTIGRAARNTKGKVIMYGDEMTIAMKIAIKETLRRRRIQENYNSKNNLIPSVIHKNKTKTTDINKDKNEKIESLLFDNNKPHKNYNLKELKKLMIKASKKLDFEKAVFYRNLIIKLENEKTEK
ncbi:excinuclease ABC subunit UvrB [Columbia Basin potato purple top phytoplasma]|uniref:UvrABC system protein B n=1 Tax=Columbia Basin potato purple top phytoplasma TaxID=307134 RepID=A0ABT5LAT5_9MOLU|nr:excinuclease ABC subunit UvrB [Columbia Basin potato purple top phytoplasma]MDC9031848.1 excinuclease ABC subunit UvrB [Columbia Basin potato purple top phytoplasma]